MKGHCEPLASCCAIMRAASQGLMEHGMLCKKSRRHLLLGLTTGTAGNPGLLQLLSSAQLLHVCSLRRLQQRHCPPLTQF